jgi:hypothetical protein
VPKREDLHLLQTIPTLGTGKADLFAVRRLASELEDQRGTASGPN